MRILIVVCLLLACLRPVSATEMRFPDPTEAVGGAGGPTYLELLRTLLPDLAPLDTGGFAGSEVVELRHIGGDGLEVPAPRHFEFGQLAALPLELAGQERLLLLFDLDGEDIYEGFAVLALFDLGRESMLVDAVQISYDRWTYFRDPAVLPLASDAALVLTMSTHFNSSQGYVISVMALARPDGLDFVDTIFTLDERLCHFERQQIPDFVLREREGGMKAIEVSVTETTRHTGQDCGGADLPEAGTRSVTATYEWDAGANVYLPDSEALGDLATETMQRF